MVQRGLNEHSESSNGVTGTSSYLLLRRERPGQTPQFSTLLIHIPTATYKRAVRARHTEVFVILFFLGILFILGEQFSNKFAIFRCTPAYI